MSGEVRRWRLHLRTGHTLGELARKINPIVRGWMQYYGAFYRSALYPLLRRINAYLMRWIRKKYKRLRPFKKARACWQRITSQYPRLFAHWAWMPQLLVTRMTRAGDGRLSRTDLWEPGGEIPRATRPKVLRASADGRMRLVKRGRVVSGSPGSTRSSWLRELMSSLVKTLRRWYSTVRGLMNSRAPISGFDSPSRASRAIWASWAVSSSRVSDGALAGGLAGGRSSRRARSANASDAHRVEHLVGGAQLLARVARGGARGAATRRRAGARGRARRGRGCGRAASIDSR